MFNRELVETVVRNNQNLFNKLLTHGEYKLMHGTPACKALLGPHEGELESLAETLGVSLELAGYTYTIKCTRDAEGKPNVKVYMPRIVLRGHTGMLNWGNTYKAIGELAEDSSLFLQPQIIKGDKSNSYYLVIGTSSGDVVLPIYPKEGVTPSTMELNQAIKTGKGWADILYPPYPTDIKSLVTADKPEFEFVATGYNLVERKGKNKAGQPFAYDEIVLQSAEGDLYSTKVNKSQNARDLRYWGEQCSPENPIKVVIKFEGVGEYGGRAYTKWGCTCTPLNAPSVNLEDLFELGEAMETEQPTIGDDIEL